MDSGKGRTVLVTGGAGFFGGVVVPDLIKAGWRVVSIDREKHWYSDPALTAVEGDIRDEKLVDKLFAEHEFAAVLHAAAVLAHGKVDRDDLWTSNVDGTRIVATAAARHKVPRLVFISSNCLWAENLGRPVTEEDVPAPIEIYGRSKWEGEKILAGLSDQLTSVVIRTPTIIEEGRLGLLAILFEFIRENRKVWTVGGGNNVYQFVYAHDLADAAMLGLDNGSGVYNVGSDDVPSLRECYEYVITQSGSKGRVAALPKAPALAAMRVASALRLSPLGPYHYRMIAEDFVFDTSKIKQELGWKPTLTNGQMLYRAYRHYFDNVDEINARTDVSAHRKATDMGPAIRLLKWMS